MARLCVRDHAPDAAADHWIGGVVRYANGGKRQQRPQIVAQLVLIGCHLKPAFTEITTQGAICSNYPV